RDRHRDATVRGHHLLEGEAGVVGAAREAVASEQHARAGDADVPILAVAVAAPDRGPAPSSVLRAQQRAEVAGGETERPVELHGAERLALRLWAAPVPAGVAHADGCGVRARRSEQRKREQQDE